MTPRRLGAPLAIVMAVLLGACAPRHASTNPLARTEHGSTTTVDARPAGFVALGDSYTAGGGAAPYDVDVPCDVSSQSWVYLLAKLEPQLHLAENRSCGGAKTDQLLHAWPERNRPAQIPSKPDASVGLVAFTIGGNDLQIVQVIASCVTANCAGVAASDKAGEYLRAFTAHLVDDVYPALRKAYPKARLVHVGYPLLTSEKIGQTCAWLSPSEVAEPNDLIQVVNTAIEKAAKESGQVEYLDVTHAFAGHELCTADPWIYDITDAAALHPTAAGYQALAAAIDKGLRG